MSTGPKTLTGALRALALAKRNLEGAQAVGDRLATQVRTEQDRRAEAERAADLYRAKAVEAADTTTANAREADRLAKLLAVEAQGRQAQADERTKLQRQCTILDQARLRAEAAMAKGIAERARLSAELVQMDRRAYDAEAALRSARQAEESPTFWNRNWLKW